MEKCVCIEGTRKKFHTTVRGICSRYARLPDFPTGKRSILRKYRKCATFWEKIMNCTCDGLLVNGIPMSKEFIEYVNSCAQWDASDYEGCITVVGKFLEMILEMVDIFENENVQEFFLQKNV